MKTIVYIIVLWLSIATASGQESSVHPLNWSRNLPVLADTLPTLEETQNRLAHPLDSLRETAKTLNNRLDSVRQIIASSPAAEVLSPITEVSVPSIPNVTPELPQVSREALIRQLQTKADQMFTQLPQVERWSHLTGKLKDLSLKEAGTNALQQLATQGEAHFQRAQQHLSAAPPTYQLQDLQKLQRLQQARQQLLDKIDVAQPAEQALQAAQGQLDQVKRKYQSIGSLQDSSSFQKKQQERSFKDRWYVGGMFHTNYSFPLQFNVAPAIGYRPWSFLLVGLSASTQFTVERSPEFHITNNHQPGYNLFVDTYKDAWFLHLEYADTWKKVASSETPSPSQQWLVGIGKTYHLHKRLKGRIMLLYNPKADELLQQKTWTVKWGFDLL